MSAWIDLHLHTCFSDGRYTAEQLIQAAREQKLSAISVTDHDSLGGYRAVSELVDENSPELIPGVELSVTMDGGDVHLLAYLFDPEDQNLTDALREFRERRNQRALRMVEKLKAMNIDISFPDVKEAAGAAAVGRPHVADVMVSGRAVQTYQEAFDKYLRNDGPAYVAKDNFSPREALSTVHAAGGIAVLAHPIVDNAWRHLEKLVDLGLDGIELYHPYHTPADREHLQHVALRYRLVTSGGSDFHGRPSHYCTIGSQNVPADLLEGLKEKAARRRENIE
ncbi:MAG: PHP domain-containing protein [bacterium]